MKRITQLLNFKLDSEVFEYFLDNLKFKGITQWNYFINWDKVYTNIEPIEKELNLLNYLIGKKDVKKELINLILDYPEVLNAIPLLLAIRFYKKNEHKIDILTDSQNYKYDHFDL